MDNKNESREIFLKIYNNNDLADEIERYNAQNEAEIISAVNAGKQGKLCNYLKRDAFFKLCLTYAYLPSAKSNYDRLGIDDTVFYQTMHDIKIWILDYYDHTGNFGLDELNWIVHHLNGNLFHIGRLQFKFGKYMCENKYTYNNSVIKLGDKILEVHIPRGDKLDYDACCASFAQAKAFFKKFFPDYPCDRYVCYSWLMFPHNSCFMRSDSNIIRFASLFDIVKTVNAPNDPYRWMFDIRVSNGKLLRNKLFHGSYGELDTLKNANSFQKAAVQYINSGGRLGIGIGVHIE